MDLTAKIASLDEHALATVLTESQRTRVTQDLTAEAIKEKLPTTPLLREYLLTEVETNVIAQAATVYVNVYLKSDLLHDDLVMDGINYIEDILGLTNNASEFTKNREQIKALHLDENNFYGEALSLAEDYLSGYDEEELEHLGEDFGPEQLFDQLMIFMIFYKSGSLSLDEIVAEQEKILRGE
ncbi:MAG: hypothetical protein ABS951_05045 [Solibacillus sp.]